MFDKRHCLKCTYTNTIVKAAYDVSRGMGIQICVCKISRCSDKGSILADALSKGDMCRVNQLWPGKSALVSVPRVIVEWIKDPREDLYLGLKVLQELRMRMGDIVC